MIGNMRVIIAKEKTIIFRNNYEGKDSSKLQLFQKGMSEVLFSNLPPQALEDSALLKDLSKTSAHDAFWLDEGRCIFENNWKERKVISVATGAVDVCDVAVEARKLYEIPQEGFFLGRSEHSIFWSMGTVVYRKDLGNGLIEQLGCPSYVEKVSGAVEVMGGKILVFASGKNPNIIHGHPGWSGVLSLDFVTKKFERIK